MSTLIMTRPRSAEEGAVVAKAVANAAEQLGLNGRQLGEVLGLSEASVSRLKKGELVLQPGDKPFELALLLIRLFRSLDAITGGDAHVTRVWMQNDNAALGAKPLNKISSITGLIDVLSYLDARRALV